MAVAVRLAHKMGLHNEKTALKMSFFEKEMRIRLWWQIRCYSARPAQASVAYIPLIRDLGNVRMPLNLNDSDLHPDMVDHPVEHVGATEMTYCLLKYEGARWQQMARTTNKRSVNPSSAHAMIPKDPPIRDLERTFEEKYLRFCDHRIPLHFLALTMSRLAICRMRFMMYHPQGRADGGAHMTPEERDVLFELSVRLLELEYESRKTSFTPQLLTHMARSKLEALVYMLFELCGRPMGDRVIVAWNLVSLFYEQHRELIDETGNSFLDALGDLTLEAWQVRWKELVEAQGGRVDDITPWYIKELQARRAESMLISSVSGNAAADASTGELAGPAMRHQLRVSGIGQSGGQMESEAPFLEISMDFGDDNPYDVEYWSEFLQM
jgi:hypothetical protein